MNYFSTRSQDLQLTSKEAIHQGLSSDGGLFVPIQFPQFKLDDLIQGNYADIQKRILKAFFDDYSNEELEKAVDHQVSRFNHPLITPLKKVGKPFVLELFHGPSAAFKDVALQILPELLKPAKATTILTATSGDTGSAALEGFRDKENIDIMVYYPTVGISDIQRKQMTCVDSANTHVYGIKGNFDDAQRAVKELFQSNQDKSLSSANSINIGRLVPQIAYYVYAYKQLIEQKALSLGEEMVVSVPTGNFGNILAAYYAKKIGCPIKHFICASNENDVLTEVIKTGTYHLNRDFMTTTSPSMDILISSNFERLLYDFSKDTQQVSTYMSDLKEKGSYTLKDAEFKELSNLFSAQSINQKEVNHTIEVTYQNTKELLDPHTAIAMHAGYQYNQKNPKDVVIIAATASPYKFPKTVLKALKQDIPNNDFEAMGKLYDLTQVEIPAFLKELKDKKEIHTTIIETSDINDSFNKVYHD